MAFTYDAGLRIRPPEPMPQCLAGESPQDYFSRVLAQCALESATTSENNSGDSAPTPFNLGQIQADVARNTADIDTLETQVGDIQTTVDALDGKVVGGVVQFASGATTAVAAFPDSGAWRVVATPVDVALTGFYISVNDLTFVATFAAAASAGSISWIAVKAS
jgi:hypothetical protein